MSNFIEERKLGIGGSDIAAILGVHPYKTAQDVYLEKVEGRDHNLDENESVVLGNLLENPLAVKYEKTTGEILTCTGTVIHPIYPYIRGNPDRLAPAELKVIEIKTTSDLNLRITGEIIKPELMDVYLLQVSHYMLCLGWPKAELVIGVIPDSVKRKIFCKLAINHFKGEQEDSFLFDVMDEVEIYRFAYERDKDIDEVIVSGAQTFWEEYVRKGAPPPLDYRHPKAKESLKKLYSNVSVDVIELTDDFILLKNDLKKNKEEMRFLQKKTEEGQAIILHAMKNAREAKLSDGSKFMRKFITTKGYTVPSYEYIRLDIKDNQVSGEKNVNTE